MEHFCSLVNKQTRLSVALQQLIQPGRIKTVKGSLSSERRDFFARIQVTSTLRLLRESIITSDLVRHTQGTFAE